MKVVRKKENDASKKSGAQKDPSINKKDGSSKSGSVNPKGKGRRRRGQKDPAAQVDEGMSDSKSNNDLDYYTKNPVLLNSASQLAVASIVGQSLNNKTGSQKRAVPGIMSFNYSPAIGPDSIAITQAADAMYSFNVHANSRNGSYDSPDLIMGTMAGEQVFDILASMIRAYGHAKDYMEQNLYVPDTTLRMMGFDPENLHSSLSNAVFDINWLITQTRNIWVPNTMPILDKRFKMNSLLYKDADTTRAQVYFFNQCRYYAFSGKEVKTGTALLEVCIDDNGKVGFSGEPFTPGMVKKRDSGSEYVQTYGWGTWKAVAQFMINQLMTMQDRGIMYGDILKNYGSEKIKALPEIDFNYKVTPVYNAEIQMQIENIVTTGYYQNAIFQLNNSVYPNWKELPELQSLEADIAPLVNFHLENVTPADVVIATRFITAGVREQRIPYLDGPITGMDVKTKAMTAPTACNTELINQIAIAKYVDDPSNDARIRQLNQFPSLDGATGIQFKTVENMLDSMAFDWHPFIYDKVATAADIMQMWGDFDNYTRIAISQLINMNNACLFSLFDVPIL